MESELNILFKPNFARFADIFINNDGRGAY